MSTAAFADKQIQDRLFQCFTTDGSGNPALRVSASGSLAADSVNDTHIDWGTGANQVSGVDIPLADAGTYFTTDNVEAALQQLAAAVLAAGAPSNATYIVQVPNGTLSAEQALSLLATGIVKNTTTTGVLSIAAAGTDYYAPGSTDVAVADGGTGSSTASDARTALGLAIGTNVQAYDAELAALAGLTSAADKLPYFTGAGTAGVADFSAYGRTLVDDADSGTARTTLGLGTIATQNANNVTISGGAITGITDLVVADGGTGVSTLTGLVKGNGTSAFTAAVQGTDYWAPGGTDVAVADGGTGASSASTARSNLGAAASASNSDITALTGIAAAGGVILNPHGAGAGNTSEIRFLELAASGSNYVGFKAPDAITANKVWVLPNADGSAGQALVTDGALVLSWASAGGSAGVFGDGSDGNVTISSPTTLTKDMFYDTLTVNDVLTPNGFIIHCKTAITGNGSGFVRADGAAGGNGTAGSGSTGGTGGTAGAASQTAGSLGAATPAGVAGGAGGGGATAPSGAGPAGGTSTGTNLTDAVGSAGANGGAGGSGGAGTPGGGGGAGGASTGGTVTVPAATRGGYKKIVPLSQWRLFPAGASPVEIQGSAQSAGGGGGGGGGTPGGGSPCGAGGGGGGSGSPGGRILIIAKAIQGSFTIQARGGAGGNGGAGAPNNGSSGAGGGGGAGSGGPGGVVGLIYNTKASWSGTSVVTGGAAGTVGAAGSTNGSAGSAGSTGTTGVTIELSTA